MTRAEQIDAAIKLLKPANRSQRRWRGNIAAMLALIDGKIASDKEDRIITGNKAALRRYIKALHKVRSAYAALDAPMGHWFKLGTVIEHDIAEAKALLESPAPRGRAMQHRDRGAVMMAYILLEQRGYERNVTRGGRWERLAQILANKNDRMTDQMAVWKRTGLRKKRRFNWSFQF